jgi:polysaccharide export outer membrane protein
MKSAAGLIAAVAAALLVGAAPLQARDIDTPAPAVSSPNGVVRYELGAGDKLKVLFYERPDLSGEFAVRPDGHLGLPLLGLFPVDGKDVSELEKDIVAAYVAATGRTPRLLIDVIERRPFYVVGVVQRSGAYPFVPGMTVLHAVALAGGTYRATSTDLPSGSASNVNREISRLRQAEATLKRAIARAARLVAERDGKDLTEIPEQLLRLTNRTEAQALIMAEKRVLQAKAADYKNRKESGVRIIETITHEIAELKAQQKQTEEKVRLNNLHLDDINTLYGKGLQRRSELLSLQALIATNEGELREAGARNARAARAMEEARRDLEALDTNRRVQAEQDLAELDKQIATAQIEADAAKTSIEQMTGVPAELAAKGTETELVYTIMRNKQGQSTSVDATETTRLEPGDVVRISVRPRSPTEPASSQQRAENQAN